VRREAQSLVLLLVGGTLIKIAMAGTYARYVKVGLRPYLLAAGAVLALVAVASLAQALRAHLRPAAAGNAGDDRGAGQEHEAHHDHDHDDGHGHGQRGLDVAWLLLVPVLALLLVAPPPLGPSAAARSGTALTAPASSDFTPLPDGDPVRVSLVDYATRAVHDKGRSLADRRVAVSGFVLAGEGGQWYLARMVVACCAADARPVKVALAGDLPADLQPGGWFEVTGRYLGRTAKDEVNAEAVPYLRVEAVRPIATPAQPYES
jgi:uncharacterized repeat protein (TIGR03943 family)